jgi:predicted permease
MIDFLSQPENLLVFKAIGRLFLISCLGYLAVRVRLLSAKAMECLSQFVIVITLPCLVLSTLGRELRFDLLPEMANCLASALLLNIIGLVVALTARRLFIPALQPGRRLFLTLAAIQNSGYLPIPLTLAILPANQQATGLLYVFVYIFVMGFIFWSMGVWLIARPQTKAGLAANLRQVANPPMIAMLAGLLFLMPQVQAGFAALPLLQEGLSIVGNTTIPLVLIILGGSFASMTRGRSGRRIINLAAVIKLLVIPCLALAVALLLELERIFVFGLILQASMPAAMNHIVVAQKYDGDVPLTSQALFIQYLLSLITVPFFLLLYNRLYL